MNSLKWQIGDVEILQIVEFEEGGALIQQAIPNATAKNVKEIDWLFPNFADQDGNFKSIVQSFLVKSNNKNILIDTCNGNGRTRPECSSWGNLNTDYLSRLRTYCKNESAIDFVVCTHFHFDHIGWNTYFENDQFVPTFKNARYLFIKKEYDYFKKKPEREIQDDWLAFDDSIKPIIKAKQERLVEANYKIDENVTLIPTHGHTPGHVSIGIHSKGQKAIISGDLIHHPFQLAYPDSKVDFDTNPADALKSRLKILNEIADTDILFFGSHFANPVAGYIKRFGSGFRFIT